MREPIRMLAYIVAVLLLVACANVASLLLARGRARARELALRAAIGASRRRIVRQLLTEGLILGAAACGAGLVLARWISSALLPALTSADNLTVRYTLDWHVMAFTCALGAGASLLFSLLPALRATRSSLEGLLQDGARAAASARTRTSGALVIAQVSLSLLLLSVAALLGWSATRLQRVDPGFDTRNLLTFSVNTSLNGYDATRARAVVARGLEALRALPGVVNASAMSHRLVANNASIGVALPAGSPEVDPASREARQIEEKNRTWRLVVDEQFFATFRIPVLRGRAFTGTESTDGALVGVVNEKLARQLFGSPDVVGREFVLGLGGAKPIRIVGVVRDARYSSLRADPPPTAYLPYQQRPALDSTVFAVRTSGDPMAMAGVVRETIRTVDPTLPLFGLRTQEQQVQRSIAQERLFAGLALMLGGLALMLSAIGLYALLAYTVTRRTAEIGVRMALGARTAHVRWMVLRQSLVLVGAGLLLGLPAAFLSGRYIESLLFGLEPTQPRAVFAATTVMVAVALAAAYVPARRASRIDPLVALRAE